MGGVRGQKNDERGIGKYPRIEGSVNYLSVGGRGCIVY
jgi:hypothetical protein